MLAVAALQANACAWVLFSRRIPRSRNLAFRKRRSRQADVLRWHACGWVRRCPTSVECGGRTMLATTYSGSEKPW